MNLVLTGRTGGTAFLSHAMDIPDQSQLAALSKEDLLARMEGLYAASKPHQDALADNAVAILAHSREVYRRIIAKHLPEAEFTETRIVTELSCSLNCLGQPAHELSRRLNKFAAEGVTIVRVEFDTVLNRYLFHTTL